jgi:hypothetical protein
MVLAAIWPSWRILYPNSGAFEGRGAVVGRDVLRRARGGRWRRSVRDTVAGVVASRSRTPHSAGAITTEPGVGLYARGGRLQLTVAGMAPRRPSVLTWPCKVTGKHFEGVAGPPSRARRVSRTGVGGAASRG